jgi:hypothetical protein
VIIVWLALTALGLYVASAETVAVAVVWLALAYTQR